MNWHDGRYGKSQRTHSLRIRHTLSLAGIWCWKHSTNRHHGKEGTTIQHWPPSSGVVLSNNAGFFPAFYLSSQKACFRNRLSGIGVIGYFHRAVSIFVCWYDIFAGKGGRVMNNYSDNKKGTLQLRNSILGIDPVEGISLLPAGITTDTDRFKCSCRSL